MESIGHQFSLPSLFLIFGPWDLRNVEHGHVALLRHVVWTCLTTFDGEFTGSVDPSLDGPPPWGPH